MGAEPGVAGPQHPDTGFRMPTARRALRSVIQVPRPLRGVPRARSQRAGKFGAADVPALAERSRVQPVLPGQSEPRGSARPGPPPGFAPSPRLSFPGHPKTERARPVASWGCLERAVKPNLAVSAGKRTEDFLFRPPSCFLCPPRRPPDSFRSTSSGSGPE